jgi:hypothetical protein
VILANSGETVTMSLLAVLMLVVGCVELICWRWVWVCREWIGCVGCVAVNGLERERIIFKWNGKKKK